VIPTLATKTSTSRGWAPGLFSIAVCKFEVSQ
jgi:hypothetical protein